MNKNLPIFDVADGLNKYATSKKDVQKGIEKIPPDSCRNLDEDIYEPWSPSANPQSRQGSLAESEVSTDEDDIS